MEPTKTEYLTSTQQCTIPADYTRNVLIVRIPSSTVKVYELNRAGSTIAEGMEQPSDSWLIYNRQSGSDPTLERTFGADGAISINWRAE